MTTMAAQEGVRFLYSVTAPALGGGALSAPGIAEPVSTPLRSSSFSLYDAARDALGSEIQVSMLHTMHVGTSSFTHNAICKPDKP